MGKKMQRIVEDLSDPDREIQILALTTITRLQFDSAVSRAQVDEMQRRLVSLAACDDPDVAFLAKKAQNYVESETRESPSQLGSPPTSTPTASQDAPTAQDGVDLSALENEPDATKVATALSRLRTRGDTGVLRRVEKFLQHADSRVRSNAVEVFEDLGDARHIRLLIPLLSDANNRVRSNVVKALGKFGDPHVRQYLANMMASEEVSMRESAVYAMSRLSGFDLTELLVSASEDPYEGVRLRAVRCLGEVDSPESTEALKKRSSDRDPKVREEALSLLAARGVDVTDLLLAEPPIEDLGRDGGLQPSNHQIQKESAEDAEFEARLEKKVEKTFRLMILEISKDLRQEELRGTLSRVLFKIGVDAFDMCRDGALRDKSLMAHYYEIVKYQDYLKGLSVKLEASPEGKVQTQILSSGLSQYRARMRASFVRMGKAFTKLYRSGGIQAEETPELATFLKLVN